MTPHNDENTNMKRRFDLFETEFFWQYISCLLKISDHLKTISLFIDNLNKKKIFLDYVHIWYYFCFSVIVSFAYCTKTR